MVFSGFYNGFELLTTKATVKTKKNHQNPVLRDGLKMVCFFVSLAFYSCFGCFCGCWWFFVSFTVGFVVGTSKPRFLLYCLLQDFRGQGIVVHCFSC